MSDDTKPDPSSQTEEPTPRKKEKARESGQIAQSREFSHFLILCTILGSLWWGVTPFAAGLKNLFIPWIAQPERFHMRGPDLESALASMMGHVLHFGLPLITIFCVVALLGGGVQTQWHMSLKTITPKWERISPLSGLKRLCSTRTLVEFLKNLLKVGFIILTAFFLVGRDISSLKLLIPLTPTWTLQETSNLVTHIIISLVAGMALLAILDYGYQWFRTFKELYMSRHEVKEEFKELQGDPSVAQKQRQMQRELAQMRNLPTKIPQATVVITNPTHYAVALRWIPEEMAAPTVIAKGSDRVAQRIRDLARTHFVPLVENPSLARGLYTRVKIDTEIFPEHYKAVAEIIRYVLRIQKKTRL